MPTDRERARQRQDREFWQRINQRMVQGAQAAPLPTTMPANPAFWRAMNQGAVQGVQGMGIPDSAAAPYAFGAVPGARPGVGLDPPPPPAPQPAASPPNIGAGTIPPLESAVRFGLKGLAPLDVTGELGAALELPPQAGIEFDPNNLSPQMRITGTGTLPAPMQQAMGEPPPTPPPPTIGPRVTQIPEIRQELPVVPPVPEKSMAGEAVPSTRIPRGAPIRRHREYRGGQRTDVRTFRPGERPPSFRERQMRLAEQAARARTGTERTTADAAMLQAQAAADQQRMAEQVIERDYERQQRQGVSQTAQMIQAIARDKVPIRDEEGRLATFTDLPPMAPGAKEALIINELEALMSEPGGMESADKIVEAWGAQPELLQSILAQQPARMNQILDQLGRPQTQPAPERTWGGWAAGEPVPAPTLPPRQMMAPWNNPANRR